MTDTCVTPITLGELQAIITRIEADLVNGAEQFIPTRYPYTYAYDYMRSHAKAFGLPATRDDGNFWSRADCAGLTRLAHGDDKEAVCRLLADAYLREHNIAVPSDSNARSEEVTPDA